MPNPNPDNLPNLAPPESAPLPSGTLGQREREILSILCSLGSANVFQVAERLSTLLAYTTVMTTLDRLFKKGFLDRTKQGRAYIYSPSLTAREIEGHRAARLVGRFFSDANSQEQTDLLVSCLVDAVHRYDDTLLDQLEAKIRAARERQAELANQEREGC